MALHRHSPKQKAVIKKKRLKGKKKK